MAELNVERVPRRSVGPWVLAALALAILVWFLGVEYSDRANPVIATGTPAGLPPSGASGSDVPLVRPANADPSLGAAVVPAANVRGAPEAVNAYLAHIARQRRAGTVLDERAAAEGLRRLAAALQAAAPTSVAIQPAADSLRGMAAQLQGEADARRQAALTQQALAVATGMLRQVQEARLPAAGGQVDMLNRAVTQVDAGRPLADQRTAVQQVFDMAGSVLERVAVARG